jgi:hypothetical protein
MRMLVADCDDEDEDDDDADVFGELCSHQRWLTISYCFANIKMRKNTQRYRKKDKLPYF